MTWPADYDREAVRRAIEQASGEGLSVADPLPDELIAAAQRLGLNAHHLRLWISDQPKWSWSSRALAVWARLNGLCDPAAPDPPEPPRCGHCGAGIAGDPALHACIGRSPVRPTNINLQLDIAAIPLKLRPLIWRKLTELLDAISAAAGSEEL